jgi:hypothetical protein
MVGRSSGTLPIGIQILVCTFFCDFQGFTGAALSGKRYFRRQNCEFENFQIYRVLSASEVLIRIAYRISAVIGSECPYFERLCCTV